MKRRDIGSMAFAGMLVASGVAQAQAPAAAASYAAMVEAAKSEQGLLVYSNLPISTWKPFRDLLAKTYPWLKFQAVDMGAELWERYFAESAAGTRTADLISTTSPDRFADFLARGEVQPYVAREIDALPAWSRPAPGLYTISASPAIIIYNRLLVKTPPESIRDIAAMAKADPQGMKGKISTYDAATNPFGLAMVANWLEGTGNTWATLEAIGPLTRPETGGAVLREKVSTGEYKMAFFLSSVSLTALERPEIKRLVGWSYIKDGGLISLQGAAVTKAAKSPNSAKIALDLMLSREGQRALAMTGLTPYREDVAQEGLPYDTLNTAREKIGDKNLIYYTYDRAKLAAWPEVAKKWKAVFKP